jgi:hypothetical protein
MNVSCPVPLTSFRGAPWVFGCRVSTAPTVRLDALLTFPDRFAIIQLNLAGPLLAVTGTVTGEVRLILLRLFPHCLLDLFRFSVRLPPVYRSTSASLSILPRQQGPAASIAGRRSGGIRGEGDSQSCFWLEVKAAFNIGGYTSEWFVGSSEEDKVSWFR